MEGGHTACFASTQLGEDGADLNIVDDGGIEVGDCGEGCAEDVGEELVVVGIIEAAFFCAGDGRAQGGEDYDVGGLFLEDVARAFLNEACHFAVSFPGLIVGRSCSFSLVEVDSSSCLDAKIGRGKNRLDEVEINYEEQYCTMIYLTSSRSDPLLLRATAESVAMGRDAFGC